MELRRENEKIVAEMSESEYNLIKNILSSLNESLEWNGEEYFLNTDINMSLSNHILLNKILLSIKRSYAI